MYDLRLEDQWLDKRHINLHYGEAGGATKRTVFHIIEVT